jgi:hypothetical protein
MERSWRNGIAIVIIAFCGIYLQWGHFSAFPSHIHAWAQADHYALAKGFVRNGFNFFKPETYVMNHQFPDDWQDPSDQSITAVDFPMHDYIPALLMHLSGNGSPAVYRLYVFIWGCLGLFFLYRLTLKITGDYIKALFVGIFAATAPLFSYYQVAMLPTIPSWATAVIGIYFYAIYRERGAGFPFFLSLLFLTLATLTRTTFLIVLLVVIGLEAFLALRRRIFPPWKHVVLAAGSLTAVLGYYLYNAWLRNTYGSLFLPNLMTPDHREEAIGLAVITLERWTFAFFSQAHYLVLLAALLAAGTRAFYLRKHRHVWGVVILLLCGYSVFAWVMMRQFADHDYYLLDTFFLPLILVLVASLASLPSWSFGRRKVWMAVIVFIFGLISLRHAEQELERRRAELPWDRVAKTAGNYFGAGSFLDSLGIDRDARVLVIDAVAPNIPFLRLDRKGYAVMAVDSSRVAKALLWDYDVVTLQNEFFLTHVYPAYPEILNRLEKVADNGRITVARSRKEGRTPLKAFLGLEGQTPLFSDSCGFKTDDCSGWNNIESVSPDDYSFRLGPDQEYGPALRVEHLDFADGKGLVLFRATLLRKADPAECDLVVELAQDGQKVYYRGIHLQEILRKEGDREKVVLTYDLRKSGVDSGQFTLYFWNRGGAELLIDELSVEIY